MCSTRKNILKHMKTILSLALAPCAAVGRGVLGKHIWAGKSHHKILHTGWLKLGQGWSRALPPAPELARTGLPWCCCCPGLPKTNPGLGTPGHGWSSWNQQEPGGRLRSSGLQQGGSKGQGARPGDIMAQPRAKQTQQGQPAQPESCSRRSKPQQTHP